MKKKSEILAYNFKIIIIMCLMLIIVIVLAGIFKLDIVSITGAYMALCGFVSVAAGFPTARKAVREALLSSKTNKEDAGRIIEKGMEK